MLTARYIEDVDFKDWVRAERQKRGWTQERLADEAGIDRVEANALETGRNKGTSHRIRQALARAFVIPIEAVGGGDVPTSAAANDNAPRNETLPGWADAERLARQRNTVPAWTIDRARRRSGLVPREGVDVAYVIDEAMQVLKYADPDEVLTKTNAELDAKIAKMKATAERDLARKKGADGAPPLKLTPPRGPKRRKRGPAKSPH